MVEEIFEYGDNVFYVVSFHDGRELIMKKDEVEVIGDGAVVPNVIYQSHHIKVRMMIQEIRASIRKIISLVGSSNDEALEKTMMGAVNTCLRMEEQVLLIEQNMLRTGRLCELDRFVGDKHGNAIDTIA